MANRIISYFKESREELQKVVWPSSRKTVNDTLIVIVISLVVAVFLGGIDYVLNIGLEQLLAR